MNFSKWITISATALLLLFPPLALGAVQDWAVGVIFLLVLAAAAGSLLPPHRAFFLQATPLAAPLAVLSFLTACSFFGSVHHYLSMIAAGQLLACLLFHYVVLHLSQERSGLIFLLYWIISISTLLCLIGLSRRNGVDPVPWLDYLGGLPRTPWLIATFVNHSHLAGWLEMSFPLLLCLILFGCQREWLPVQLLLLILQGVCLILTYSRGGWAGAAAAILFILIWLLAEHRSRRWRIVFFSSVLAAVISVLLLASPLIVRRLHEAELASRMLAWRGTVDMILAHWLTGSGPGTYPFVFAQFQPPGLGDVRFNRAHNDYLQFTAELGVGLPLLIIWMMAAVYRHGLRKLDVSSSRLINAATLGSLAGITAMAVHSVADFNLHIPANALLFSALAAIAISDTAVG